MLMIRWNRWKWNELDERRCSDYCFSYLWYKWKFRPNSGIKSIFESWEGMEVRKLNGISNIEWKFEHRIEVRTSNCSSIIEWKFEYRMEVRTSNGSSNIKCEFNIRIFEFYNYLESTQNDIRIQAIKYHQLALPIPQHIANIDNRNAFNWQTSDLKPLFIISLPSICAELHYAVIMPRLISTEYGEHNQNLRKHRNWRWQRNQSNTSNHSSVCQNH